MKKILLSIFVLLIFAGCKERIQDFGDLDFLTANDAIIKINMASVYPDDRYMYVKFNDNRVTPLIRAREPYPGGGYNTRGDSRPDFLRIASGTVNVKICLPHKKDNGKDSIILNEQNLTFLPGKQYTIHVTDTAANTKMFLAEESFVRPDSSFAKYRFVNLMPNVEALDLYYGAAANSSGQDSLIVSNVKYGETSDYFTIRRATARTWKIRKAGDPISDNNVLALYTNASSTLNARSYTAYALGYAGFTSTIMKPYVSFYLVR